MILDIIKLALLVVFLYLAFYFIIIPKLRIRHYVKQGIKVYKFYPMYGWLKDAIFLKTNKFKDSLHEVKNLSHNPEYKDQEILLGNVANQAFLVLIKPELINEFLQRQNEYIKYEPPFYGFNKFLGHGLSKTYGEEWKRSRKVLSNMFTFDQISAQLGRVKEITRSYMDKENSKGFNINRVFEKSSGSSDLQIMLGAEVESYKNADGKSLSELIDTFSTDVYLHFMHPIPMIIGQDIVNLKLRESDRKILKRIEEMRNFMTNILVDCVNREKDPAYKCEYPSYITYLLKVGNLTKPEEIKDLLAISFNLYMAAKDTTSKLAVMVAYYLIKYPKQYQLVYEEIQKYAAGDDYSYNDLQQLNHLQANIKESMRMDTSAPMLFSRVALEDHHLGKYSIKKGTLVNAGYFANFYNEKYFKDPFTYNPDRWFDQEEDMRMKENNFVFIPFSGGARNCIGQHLAWMQVKVMIVEFVKRFKVPSLPLDFDLEKTMTQSYGFKHHLEVQVQNRNK